MALKVPLVRDNRCLAYENTKALQNSTIKILMGQESQPNLFHSLFTYEKSAKNFPLKKYQK